MIELSRHIENLMLKHDCVIVPGLGGFVTQYVSAQRVGSENLFLPPHRTVGFNQQLTLNDGLLVQSYMQAYETSYPETLKLIDNAVRQLKEELQREGSYELSGIGVLTLGVNGNYKFTPCESGVLSPDLYGLDSLSLPELTATEEKEVPNVIRACKKKINLQRTEKEYTISINRELVNYVAASVVAILFYFLWASPVNHSAASDQMAASVVYENLFFPNKQTAEPLPKVTTPTVELKKVEQNAPILDLSKNKETKSPEVAPVAPTPIVQKDTAKEGNFTLVVASAIPSDNAEAFVQKLKANGFPDAESYTRKKMVRVIYGHYATQEEAQDSLQRLRDNEIFEDAWVLKTK